MLNNHLESNSKVYQNKKKMQKMILIHLLRAFIRVLKTKSLYTNVHKQI